MTIRDAVAADVPAMLAIYAPFVRETAVSFEYEVPSEAEFWQRIQAHRKILPWLVCEEDGHETARFPAVGFKLGQWYDVVWLEKQLPTEENPKNFPKPY